MNFIKSLSEEVIDIREIKLDEDGLFHIINIFEIGFIENIDNLEKVSSFVDSCKPILDKYVIDTGLSVYPILLISAIGRFINIDIKDMSSNYGFSKQLAKYSEFFQSSIT